MERVARDLSRQFGKPVEVETQGRWTAGMTVTDFGADAHNALVAMSVDAAGFWDMVVGALHRTAAAMDAG